MKSLLIACVAGAATLGALNDTDTDDTTGTIRGKVTWEGDEMPEPKPDLVVKQEESQGCHSHGEMDLKDRSLLIDPKSKGVANVVVLLEVEGFEPELPTEPITLDQKGCRFEPHVVVVPAGAKLKYDNSDETNHNVHSFSRKNDQINKNIAGGQAFEQVLDKAESFEVKCDIHPWMKSHIVVTDATHYAKTNPDGSFELKGVPPGKYKLEWWHEELGKGKTEDVTVVAGEAAAADFAVGEKKQAGGGRRRR